MRHDPDEAGHSTTINVPVVELYEVAVLVERFTPSDERDPLGAVPLTSVDGKRRWIAGNGSTLVDIAGADDDTCPTVMLPTSLVQFGASLDTDEVELVLRWDDDGTTRARIGTDQASLEREVMHEPHPALTSMLDPRPATVAAVTTQAERIAAIAHRISYAPVALADDETAPLCWVTLSDGTIEVHIDWGVIGTADYRIEATGQGTARTAAPPKTFAELLMGFHGEITISLTEDPDGPIIVDGIGISARTLGVPTTFERLRGEVEERLVDAFGRLATVRDDDGDYPIRAHGVPIYARLLDEHPVAVQVFAVILDGVELDDSLLQELNELNLGIRFARLAWVQKQVIAEADLVAHTLDVDELRTAAMRVHDVAHRIAPMLAAVHGGHIPDLSTGRWELYRRTVIEAETSPGRWTALCGPDAVPTWDLPSPMYVLTACEPHGIPMPDEENLRANDALAADIQEAGGAYVRCVGTAPDGSHREPGFLVWDITAEYAQWLGRRHEQDAIYRIDAEELTLVSCVDDHVESWPRVGPRD